MAQCNTYDSRYFIISTRGLYGFRKNGQDKMTFHPHDSYLDGLGLMIARFRCAYSLEELNSVFDLRFWWTRTHNRQKNSGGGLMKWKPEEEGLPDKWSVYQAILRMDPDNLWDAILDTGEAFITDNSYFIFDSLLCEYG